MKRTLLLATLAIALCLGLYWALKTPAQSAHLPKPELETSTPVELANAQQPKLALEIPDASETPADDSRNGVDIAELGEMVRIKVIAKRARNALKGVPNINVRVGASKMHQAISIVFAEGTTDENGVAEFLVPMSLIESGQTLRNPRLRAEVAHLGKIDNSCGADLPTSADEVPELIVTLTPGLTIHGILYGPNGEPAAGMVWFRPENSGLNLRETRAFQDGRFSFTAYSEGAGRFFGQATSADVFGALPFWANQQDLGTGISERFEVRFDKRFESVEVHAKGPGVVQGIVLDGNNRPARGLRLEALRASAESDDTYEGGGLLRAEAMTNKDGHFVFKGLRDGYFNVRAGTDLFEYEKLITQTPVLSDGVPLTLQLARPRIVVRLKNPDGTNFKGVAGFLKAYPNMNERIRMIGTDYQIMHVVAALAAGEPLEQNKAFVEIEGDKVGTHVVTFEVECGRRYEIGLFGTLYGWKPVEVQVPAHGGEVIIDLTISTPPKAGVLEITVTDEEGVPVGRPILGDLWDARGEVHLRKIALGANLNAADRWPVSLSFPAGEYVMVLYAVDQNIRRGKPAKPSDLGEATVSFSIAGEATTTRMVRLPLGASLHLTLQGTPTQVDLEAAESSRRGSKDYASEVTVSIQRARHDPQKVRFYGDTSTTESEVPSKRVALLGTSAVSAVYPAGKYKLTAHTRGGRTVSKVIELKAGETLNVTLNFDE